MNETSAHDPATDDTTRVQSSDTGSTTTVSSTDSNTDGALDEGRTTPGGAAAGDGTTYGTGGGSVSDTGSDTGRRRGGLHPLRHVLGLLLAVVLVPVGLFLLDYAWSHQSGPLSTLDPESNQMDTTTAAYVGAGIGVLLVVALLSRMSGFAVLAAGIVWGVVPSVIAIARPMYLPRHVTDLPDLYTGIGLGLAGAQLFVFPILAALLVGLGLTGRYRARR